MSHKDEGIDPVQPARRAKRTHKIVDLAPSEVSEVASAPLVDAEPGVAPETAAPVERPADAASPAADPVAPPVAEHSETPPSETPAQQPEPPRTKPSRWGLNTVTSDAALLAVLLGGGTGLIAGALAAGLLLLAGVGSPDDDLVASAAKVQGLDMRLVRLEQRPAPPAVQPGDLAALAERIATVERTSGAVATLDKRMSGVEQALAAGRQAGAAAAATGAIAPGADGAIRAAAEAAAEAGRIAAALQARVQTAVQPDALQPLRADLKSAQERLAALAGRLEALETRYGPAGANRVATWPVALGALRTALDAGRPFANELAAALALAGSERARLEVLTPFAAGGVSTLADLGKSFATLAPALAKAVPRPEPQGVLDQIVRSTESLVRVRTVGSGEGPGAAIGLAEARLRAGDLAGALEAAQAWPEPVKAVGATWLKTATLRRDADRLLSRLMTEALAALAAPRG